jgi:uncharacterized protein (DUF58 family)
MPKQRRTTLCPEGGYYLLMLVALFGVVLWGEFNLLLLLTGPLVIGWRWVVVSMTGLEPRRRIPRAISAGDLLVVNVDLTNTRRRMGSWAVVGEDQIRRVDESGRRRTIRPMVYFPHVAAGGCRRQVYRGRLPRRGRYLVGPMKLSTRFPFGLLRRTVTDPATDTLTVYPRLGRLTQAWKARRHRTFEGSRRVQQQPSRIAGDFFGVREWQTGDSLRWIHWRSSARHGDLVVRQFEPQKSDDLAVLVDLWQPDRPDTEDLQNVELAVSFAATVVADACRKGGGHLLVGIGGEEPEWIEGPVSVGLLEGTMEKLAVARACREDRLPQLLEWIAGRMDSRTEVVLVGTRGVDLDDPGRFPVPGDDRARRALVGRIRRIDTSSEELSRYFLPQ